MFNYDDMHFSSCSRLVNDFTSLWIPFHWIKLRHFIWISFVFAIEIQLITTYLRCDYTFVLTIRYYYSSSCFKFLLYTHHID